MVCKTIVYQQCVIAIHTGSKTQTRPLLNTLICLCFQTSMTIIHDALCVIIVEDIYEDLLSMRIILSFITAYELLWLFIVSVKTHYKGWYKALYVCTSSKVLAK